MNISRLVLLSLLSMSAALVQASPLPAQPHVYVEGSAEVEVEPDMMTFGLSIQATNKDLAAAKTAVDARSRRLIEACKKMGIKAVDIATTALNIHPEYDYKDGSRVLVGNQVSRQVDIKLRDLKKYPEFMQTLVAAEITETINTNLTLSDMQSLQDKAQMLAMKDAQARAERLAKSQGKKLGEPWSISEFNNRQSESWELRPSREMMGSSAVMKADVSSLQRMASEPFEPGVMKLKTELFVVYLLK